MDQIYKNRDGDYGVLSWADGFRKPSHELSLGEEAKRNPEAVINRLMRTGEYDTAERIMDKYV